MDCLKPMKLLDTQLIELCAVIRLNTVIQVLGQVL